MSGPTPWRTAKHKDFHPFTTENLKWYEEQGCELVKVCAGPGDLIMWDSRQIHWARFGESDLIRTLIYATYTPAKWMTSENILLKREMFHQRNTTTHWPHCNLYTHGEATVDCDGKKVTDPLERDEPVTKLVESERLLKLAGVLPYV